MRYLKKYFESISNYNSIKSYILNHKDGWSEIDPPEYNHWKWQLEYLLDEGMYGWKLKNLIK
jgi:hypothetical protein